MYSTSRCLRLVLILNHLYITVNAITSIFLLPSNCGTVQPADVGLIIRSNENENYTIGAENCTFVMTATSASHRLRFDFNTGNGEVGILENPMNNGSSCNGASFEIFDGPNTNAPSLSNSLCGELTRNELLSTGDTLTLMLFSVNNNTAVNFTVHYTSFTELSDCGSDFPCANGRCVSTDMQCDPTRIDNCGDFTDNLAGPPGNCSSETTTTDAATTTAVTTPTTTLASGTGYTDLTPVYIGVGVAGGLVLLYLHWLIFKPRWIIWQLLWYWRRGCCRSICNCFGRNAVDSTPSMDKINTATPDVDRRNDESNLSSSPEPSSSEPSRESARVHIEITESPFIRGIAKEKHLFDIKP